MARGRKAQSFKSALTEADEKMVADLIGRTRWDPHGFSLAAYDWGHGDLIDFHGPKTFQRDVMLKVRDHLTNPLTRYTPFKCAIASGKGIGKTALIAMLINWGLSTCVDTRLRVTANTEDQLRLVVWSEVRKWHNQSLCGHWFNDSATSLYSALPAHEATWRADAVTWSMSNLEAFAGFHNYGKRLIAIVDEGSGIHDGVFDNMEGFLTDANTELLVFVFGNPTKNYGRFYEIFEGKNKDTNGWYKLRIDSRTVEGINKEQIASMEREYGIDSDIFKVTVRGLFPSTSFEQFVSTELISEAVKRDVLRESQYRAPCILGVDPAHSQDDIAIVARQGLWSQVCEVFKKTAQENDELIANRVAYWEDELQADAVNIDLGWGTGVKTVGDMMNRKWRLIAFGASSPENTTRNMRAYMYSELRKWLKDGGSLNGDDTLGKEIGMPERRTDGQGRILIESKDDMKKRLGKAYYSPGRADGLALTFARPVVKKRNVDDLDPFEATRNDTSGRGSFSRLPDPRL